MRTDHLLYFPAHGPLLQVGPSGASGACVAGNGTNPRGEDAKQGFFFDGAT